MPKILAEVALGGLQTVNKLPEDYNREYKVRIKCNKKISIFDALNYMISSWVAGQRPINFEELSYAFHTALESGRKNPGVFRKKGKLLFHLSKYDLNDFVRNPENVRKRLLRINQIESILYSPRSLKSEKWKGLNDIKFYICIEPGLSKRDFPEVAYIGVGYRDKGNCRIKSLDGQQSWQELAQSDFEIPIKKKLKPRSREHFHYSNILDPNWTRLRAMQVRRSSKARRQEFSMFD